MADLAHQCSCTQVNLISLVLFLLPSLISTVMSHCIIIQAAIVPPSSLHDNNMSGKHRALEKDDNIDTLLNDTDYGEHQSRRQTMYYYHQSGSLSPAQIMMTGILYDQAEDYLIHSLILKRVITTLLLLCKHVFANQSATIGDIFKSEYIAKINHIIKRLHFILKWTKSYTELALLYAEDISIFNHH